MKIEFAKMDPRRIPSFKGGTGALIAKMQEEPKCRFLLGRLEPGSSIGEHVHETNEEIIYILEGTGQCLYDGVLETLNPGDCHYCPLGHSHKLMNNSDADLVFFAAVPERS